MSPSSVSSAIEAGVSVHTTSISEDRSGEDVRTVRRSSTSATNDVAVVERFAGSVRI